jgi:hypothetical protein
LHSSFVMIRLNHGIACKISHSLDWISFCYCSIKNVEVFARSCLHLKSTQRLIHVDRQCYPSEVFSYRILNDRPNAYSYLRIFEER